MAVRFRCACGAILTAKEELIESIKPCPHCHVDLRIPHAATKERECVRYKKPIARSHTIWVRGRRLCWKCMPPEAVHIDLMEIGRAHV